MGITLNKTCKRCGKLKPTKEFNKRAREKDGLRPTCRSCDVDLKADYRQRVKAAEKVAAAFPSVPTPSPSPSRPPARLPEALSPGSGSPGKTEGGGLAPAPSPSVPEPGPEPGDKVIGRIGGPPRIKEFVVDPVEEEDKARAREYANLLNKKLSIRQRANLMVKIAKNVQGPTAALALQALKDINLATGVVSKAGAQVEVGPLFVMPEGTKMKMGGGA